MRLPPASRLILLGMLAPLGCSRGNAPTTSAPALPEPVVATQDLFSARAGYQTKLVPNSYKADGPAAVLQPGRRL